MRIIEGNGVGGSPLDSHETAIKGGLGEDDYRVTIDGVNKKPGKLKDVYLMLLKGLN